MHAFATQRRQDYGYYLFLHTTDSSGESKPQLCIHSCDKPLKEFLVDVAENNEVELRSLRVQHAGRSVFLSEIGKKTARELQMTNGLHVTYNQHLDTEEEKDQTTEKPKRQKQQTCAKRKHKAKGRRKKSAPALPTEDTHEKCKRSWMDSMQQVFGEAQQAFKEIRQELDAMNLQRTAPKERKRQQKSEPEDEPIANPSADGLGGKAGRSQFIVQVGDVSNLYKTAKPNLRQARTDNIMLDLHGLTKGEALETLDECLAQWVDMAMQEPPFVILVKIVCGGGSQTLAEAVEGWIRNRKNVANAPKSVYS